MILVSELLEVARTLLRGPSVDTFLLISTLILFSLVFPMSVMFCLSHENARASFEPPLGCWESDRNIQLLITEPSLQACNLISDFKVLRG